MYTFEPICIYTCLYLYMCVFSWRNPHLEQIAFCHYPHNINRYIHTFEPIYIYMFVSILVYVRIWVAKPTLRTNHILPLSISIYIYTFEPICIYTFVSGTCAYLAGETHT